MTQMNSVYRTNNNNNLSYQATRCQLEQVNQILLIKREEAKQARDEEKRRE